jgi:hypothetical protein
MEMTSEDEAYDPWPGCYMDSTGCHYATYYSDTYILNEKFAKFFNLEKNSQFTKKDIDDVIIKYLDENKCIAKYGTNISYNEPLWNLFELECNKTLKLYQLERYFIKFIIKVQAEPVHIFSTKLDAI